jgi:hypothetical protein
VFLYKRSVKGEKWHAETSAAELMYSGRTQAAAAGIAFKAAEAATGAKPYLHPTHSQQIANISFLGRWMLPHNEANH